MSSRRALVAAGALSAALVPVAAHAEIAERPDARGDAPSFIDVHAVMYAHGSDRVSVAATIPSLGRRGSASLSISQFTTFEAGHVVTIRKSPGRPVTVRLAYFNHFDLEPRRCGGVKGSWRPAKVTLSVPRACLGEDATERVFVQFGIQHGNAIDRAPAVRRLQRS